MKRVLAFVRPLLGCAAAAALLWTLHQSWSVARTYLLPRPLIFVGVALLGLIAGIASAGSWAALSAPVGLRKRPFVAFLASQPTRYLPLGTAVQIASIVKLSADPAGPPRALFGTFLLHALVTLCAAMSLAGIGVLAPSGNVLVRAAGSAGLIGFLMLLPSVHRCMESITARWPRRLHDALAATKSRIPASFAWDIVALCASALTFAILLGPADARGCVTVMAAWLIAWSAGFIALPFPSGVGVRELVLTTLLPGHPAAAIVAASLAQRVAVLLAELILFALTWRSVYAARSEEQAD